MSIMFLLLLLFVQYCTSQPEECVQLTPTHVMSPDDGDLRLTSIRKFLQGEMLIRGSSRYRVVWYTYRPESTQLQTNLAFSKNAQTIIDAAYTDSQIHLLIKESGKRYSTRIYSIDEHQIRTVPTQIINLNIDFSPERIFATDDSSSFVIGTSLEFHQGERYHFHQVATTGEVLRSFGPTIVLADSIPFHSLYYFSSVNWHPNYGYTVTYWNVPKIFVFAETGEEKLRYEFDDVTELPSFYSYNPQTKFGMRIPKQRLLGNSAFDKDGLLWVPVVQMEGEDFYTEIRVYKAKQIAAKYRIPGYKILGIEISEDSRFLYAHTLKEFLYFELYDEKYN